MPKKTRGGRSGRTNMSVSVKKSGKQKGYFGEISRIISPERLDFRRKFDII
jgi:hypothetical protein